ncbi:MAG: glycerate kinase [Eubacteriales bacterium]|nr:glycerate kinase [Eubacteriales bacterium]
MRKIVVIPDSFKGTISSMNICKIAVTVIKKYYPACEVITVPVADGGEGTVACFSEVLDGESVRVTVKGPYGEDVAASYLRSGKTAIIEMASAAGLPLTEARPNPAITTTYGVGQQILHAIEAGATEIILGLGGSATNDAGCGCAAALGVCFQNTAGEAFVPTGETLHQIVSIDLTEAKKRLSGCTLSAMCDIDNPMHGRSGAAYVFAPQKGASPEMVERLDANLIYLDRLIRSQLKKDVSTLPGGGAAGGFGAGVVAFLDGILTPGIDTVLDLVEFDRLAQGADFILTGEGRIDSQSLRGKVVAGVAKRASALNIPVVAVVGDVSDDAYAVYDLGVTAIFSTNRKAIPFSEARMRSAEDFSHTLEDVIRFSTIFQQNG